MSENSFTVLRPKNTNQCPQVLGVALKAKNETFTSLKEAMKFFGKKLPGYAEIQPVKKKENEFSVKMPEKKIMIFRLQRLEAH